MKGITRYFPTKTRSNAFTFFMEIRLGFCFLWIAVWNFSYKMCFLRRIAPRGQKIVFFGHATAQNLVSTSNYTVYIHEKSWIQMGENRPTLISYLYSVKNYIGVELWMFMLIVLNGSIFLCNGNVIYKTIEN